MRKCEHLPEPIDPARRQLLLAGLGGAGLLAVGPLLTSCAGGGRIRPAQPKSNIGALGPLQPADENGIRTPAGFSTRVVARSGEDPTGDSGYRWHTFPDGGATYPAADGGWIYVCNSESVPGGVGALRFGRNGTTVDAYPILTGTNLNCSGGPTPWGTWLSCEEHDAGFVYECDPTGQSVTVRSGNIKMALGTFSHEAVAVDPDRRQLYLTEDQPDGGLYRFTPARYPDLADGVLEIAEVVGNDSSTRREVVWHLVPNPNPTLAAANPGDNIPGGLELVGTPTRHQVAASTAFDGGEGVGYFEDVVYFTTKGDNRVWAYDAAAGTIEIIYDDDLFGQAVLTGVDNVVISAAGDVLVAEDGGDMQVVALTPQRELVPLVQVVGQPESEITGPAFSPDGSRLYFNSQRGPETNSRGISYEVTGPFFSRPLKAGFV